MDNLKRVAVWTLAGAVGVFIGVVGGWWYISHYMVVRTAENDSQIVFYGEVEGAVCRGVLTGAFEIVNEVCGLEAVK
jgi:DNA-binding transcriptional regulator of glucitol operon